MNTTGRKPHPFGLLHRYGGIASAILVILICTTGLLLNHTDDLNLGKRYIASNWLLDWYGIQVPPATSFSANNKTATQLNESVFAETHALPGRYSTLRGIVDNGELTVIATSNQLILLTTAGLYIETLNQAHNTPTNILRIGLDKQNRILLETGSGILRGDPSLSLWEPVTTGITNWSARFSLPNDQMDKIAAQYRGAGLTLERVTLDLHSGRIFGTAGPWLADAAAILFILLAMTGIWMWFKTRRRNT